MCAPCLRYLLFSILLLPATIISAQSDLPVRFTGDNAGKDISVYIGKKLFTRFLALDSMAKPILFPIISASGKTVTRGYPLAPRPGEPTDHPHHTGLWLNYENVNGIDFWNNSFAIPAEKKMNYGHIAVDSIWRLGGAGFGEIDYAGRWCTWQNKSLMKEHTAMKFWAQKNLRFIDRTTELTADTIISLPDVKDGLLGLRVARELQIATGGRNEFTDNKGITTVTMADSLGTGDYLTSEGKHGDSAWATRATWCRLSGKLGGDSISIVILDHPKNPGYPTYWHARGYGLFAANPLGQKVFSNGKESLNLRLQPGETIRFHYRIIIADGKKLLSPEEIAGLQKTFDRTP